MRKRLYLFLQSLLLAGMMTACSNIGVGELTVVSKTSAPQQEGYPVVETLVAGYPGQNTGAVFQTPEPPRDVPLPSEGKGVVSGVLYSMNAKVLIPGTLLYLTPAVGPEKRSVPPILTGPNESKGDIQGVSNDKGQFILTDVPPGNYFLVVSSPLSWSLAETPETGQPRLIEVAPDKIVPLGVVNLSWP